MQHRFPLPIRTSAAFVLVLVSFTACGTLFNGKAGQISVVSNPVGAAIQVNGEDYGTTPVTLNLQKSKGPYNVTFRKEGYQTVSCQVTRTVGAGWVILDILGGLLPVIIDAVTGGWFGLDGHSCNVMLPQVENLLPEQLPATPLSNIRAQEPLRVQVGDRVRVAVPTFDIDQYDGTVQALTGDTLVLQSRRGTGVSTLRMAFVSITRLDIHRGRKGHSLQGAAIGAVVGGTITLVAGLVACEDDFVFTRQQCIVLTTFSVATLGALVGAIVGAIVVTDRWEEVSLDRLRVTFVPQRDGRFAFGLSVRF